MSGRGVSVLWLVAAVTAFAAEPPAIPPAPGPWLKPVATEFAEARSFTASERIVGTYYFYWYCANTKEHIIDGDGTDALTDHPATMEDFSYRSAAWHKRELLDMTAAGIDVVLPVFWGAPSEHDKASGLHWSYTGLRKLVEAREELLREGKSPPRIGMFYDTSTLQNNRWNQHVDLTTDYGREWFYATVRDFFSLVPPRHWAMIDDKPVVLLYAAAFAKAHDQSCIDHAKARFASDFAGRVPWIASEVSWQVRADSKVVWGGALGLRLAGVASLGPGYDHSAVPGRAPLIVGRDGGKFYEDNWLRLLRRPCPFVMVETWNEFHEGTDVAASREYGRQYIELTRKYADLFKRGWKPPWPQGPYSGVPSVTVELGGELRGRGLRLVENADGQTEAANLDGSAARVTKRGATAGTYVYFAVDDSFKVGDTMELLLEVEYHDSAPGTLRVEFDGSDPAEPFDGAYTASPEVVPLKGAGGWQTARFRLPGARLVNSQNNGADLRLVPAAPAFGVRKVTLRRQTTE